MIFRIVDIDPRPQTVCLALIQMKLAMGHTSYALVSVLCAKESSIKDSADG